MSEEIKKAIFTVLWQMLGAAIVAAIAVLIKLLPTVGLSEAITAVVILILNQVMTVINRQFQLGKKALGMFKK
jgi:hypothetical protein